MENSEWIPVDFVSALLFLQKHEVVAEAKVSGYRNIYDYTDFEFDLGRALKFCDNQWYIRGPQDIINNFLQEGKDA
jgi:hypothetical protein